MAVTHRRLRSTRLLLVALLLGALVVITVDARGGREGPMAAVGRAGATVIGPLQEGVAVVFRPVGSWITNVFRAGSLAEENAALEEALQLARREQQQIASYESENQELRQLLELRERLDYDATDTLGAQVVGEAVGNFEWSVYIDRGSNDGVTQDMPVIAAEGLVGRVTEVYPFQSKVLLIIDPDSGVSARLSRSGERGVIEGQRDEPLRMSFIDPEADVQPGETVETSGYVLEEGLEGLYPSAIPIGVVSLVERGEDDVTVDVLVSPNVDFSTLSNVLLVTETEFQEPPSTTSSPSPSPEETGAAP
jgi:rod shape-determining protein MreC